MTFNENTITKMKKYFSLIQLYADINLIKHEENNKFHRFIIGANYVKTFKRLIKELNITKLSCFTYPIICGYELYE